MATRIILTSGSSWTVPSDWNSANNTIECIGGGQGGSISTTSAQGGDYAKIANLALTPGANISYQIGAGGTGSTSSTKNSGGDTWFDTTSTVLAPGGGSATTAVGSTTYSGGGGLSARGGGGAAGPNGNGNNPSATTGGSGGAGFGGSGGTGGSTTNPGSPGTEWSTAGSGGGGGGASSTGIAAGAGGNYGGAGGDAATSGTGGNGTHGVIVLTYTPAAAGSETFTVNETLGAATLAATLTDSAPVNNLSVVQTLQAATLAAGLSRVDTLVVGAMLAPATMYSVMQSAGAPLPPSSFSGAANSSSVEIYNRALSRIGIDQFLGDPNETSKAGTLYRMWYDACRQTALRDFPWNFATTILALAPLANASVPGWGYVYAYPVDCLQARQICNADGARTTLAGVLYGDTFDYPWSTAYQGGYPAIGVPKMPFKVMSISTASGAPQRVLVTDMPNAFLVYTINVTDTGQFDAGFMDSLEWLIASEVAGPFIGAPAGPQVAMDCGKYYRNAVLNARAQNLNESTPDTRPDSPAISARL